MNYFKLSTRLILNAVLVFLSYRETGYFTAIMLVFIVANAELDSKIIEHLLTKIQD